MNDMSPTLAIRPAQRQQAKPLVGLYAESGCGKTYSALLLARGFVGPKGRIVMIETESGRGESYADPAEYPEVGGYEVIPLRGSFSPSVYGQAITVAERAKADALIIDSASTEWEGTDGVLAMAADNQSKGMKGVIVWQKPKIEHARNFMLRLTQSPIPLIICCMRAKYPMKEVVGRTGQKEWVRSEDLEPKQSEDILFEMFIHGWIDRTHNLHVTRCTAKRLEAVFVDGKPITLDTGRGLAAWAASAVPGPVVEKELMPGQIAAAMDAARRGRAALREHWKTLSKASKDAMRSSVDELGQIADEADRDAEEPDPFGLPPLESPPSPGNPAGEEREPAAPAGVNVAGDSASSTAEPGRQDSLSLAVEVPMKAGKPSWQAWESDMRKLIAGATDFAWLAMLDEDNRANWEAFKAAAPRGHQLLRAALTERAKQLQDGQS